MKKAVKITAIVLAAVLVVCLVTGTFTVRENEYACTVRFSKIIRTTDTPGLHFKIPFLDSVKYFPKAAMLYDIPPSEVLTSDKQNMTADCYILWRIEDPYDIPPSEVLTSDKQNMTADCYILWRIEDPLKFYQTLGSIPVAEQRLNALTYNALKTVMGTLAQADIINMDDGGERNQIYEGISTSVDNLSDSYGIAVDDVKIKRFDLPESNENAVYSRMISERNQIAEKFTADGNYDAAIIRNDVDKQVNIIVSNAKAEAAKLEAEGEAEYMRMLAQAYDTPQKREFYEFTIALDALEQSLTGEEKTAKLEAEGEAEYMRMLAQAYDTPQKREFYEFTIALDALEQSLTGEEKTIILDADSALAKILAGAR